jgi:hypothetical protein
MIYAPFSATMQRSRRIGTEHSPSRTARSLRELPGVMFPPKKTTKSLASLNRSSQGLPQTFNLWSRTHGNMPQRAAGATLNSTTANPLAWWCKPAIPAMCRPRVTTFFLPVIRPEFSVECQVAFCIDRISHRAKSLATTKKVHRSGGQDKSMIWNICLLPEADPAS